MQRRAALTAKKCPGQLSQVPTLKRLREYGIYKSQPKNEDEKQQLFMKARAVPPVSKLYAAHGERRTFATAPVPNYTPGLHNWLPQIDMAEPALSFVGAGSRCARRAGPQLHG